MVRLTFPNNWVQIPLEQLIIFAIGGDWGKSADYADKNFVRVCCIRGSEFRNWDSDKGSTASIRKVKKESLETRNLLDGDILVEISGGGPDQPVGRTVLIDKSVLSIKPDLPKICTNFLRLIRPSKEISSRYLNYFLVFFYTSGEIVKYQGGSNNLRNLKFNDFLGVEIPIPSENEQHRIVSKIEELFSQVDKGVESLTTVREQLKVYRQALLKDAFTGKLSEKWRAEHADQLETADQLLARIKKERERRYREQLAEWEQAIVEWEAKGKCDEKPVKPRKLAHSRTITANERAQLPELPSGWIWIRLGDLNVDIFDGPFGSNLKTSDYVESGVRVIRLENIGPLEFKDKNKSFITEEKYLSLKKHTVGGGDIIFSSFVADGNRVAIVPENIDVAVNKADCFCVRCFGESASNHYVATFLSTRHAYKQLENQVHGATRPRVNTTQLKNCFIPLAPSREQRQVMGLVYEAFSVIDRLNTELDENLVKAATFRQSILKKAFSGQLVPQDPNDEPAATLLARIKAERGATQQQSRKQPHKGKIKKEVITMADLMEVMKAAKDWLSAQEAFRRCGIADGAETEAIETIYTELRGYVQGGTVTVERRGQEDWLRLAEGA